LGEEATTIVQEIELTVRMIKAGFHEQKAVQVSKSNQGVDNFTIAEVVTI